MWLIAKQNHKEIWIISLMQIDVEIRLFNWIHSTWHSRLPLHDGVETGQYDESITKFREREKMEGKLVCDVCYHMGLWTHSLDRLKFHYGQIIRSNLVTLFTFSFHNVNSLNSKHHIIEWNRPSNDLNLPSFFLSYLWAHTFDPGRWILWDTLNFII